MLLQVWFHSSATLSCALKSLGVCCVSALTSFFQYVQYFQGGDVPKSFSQSDTCKSTPDFLPKHFKKAELSNTYKRSVTCFGQDHTQKLLEHWVHCPAYSPLPCSAWPLWLPIWALPTPACCTGFYIAQSLSCRLSGVRWPSSRLVTCPGGSCSSMFCHSRQKLFFLRIVLRCSKPLNMQISRLPAFEGSRFSECPKASRFPSSQNFKFFVCLHLATSVSVLSNWKTRIAKLPTLQKVGVPTRKHPKNS